MDKFLETQTKQMRGIQESQNNDTQNTVASNTEDEILEILQERREIGARSPQLQCSESTMSLDSVESAETSHCCVTIDTISNSSFGPEKRRLISRFFNVDQKGLATCTNCSKTLKVQAGSNSNLKVHYQRYHPAQHNNLKAALEGASRRGRYKSPQDPRRQASIDETLKEKFSQKKCLDLYYKYVILLILYL